VCIPYCDHKKKFYAATPLTLDYISITNHVSMPNASNMPTRRLSKASKTPQDAPVRTGKARFPGVPWDRNPEWTEAMIAICMDDETIREGLFHDSKKRKNATGKPKKHYWNLLVEEIFAEEADLNDADTRKHYADSIGNRLA
jgi:hypothetical protein